MPSKLTIEMLNDQFSGGRTWRLFVPSGAIADLKLSEFDQALLDDIQFGPKSKTPVADILLGLETIVRRIEEQNQ